MQGVRRVWLLTGLEDEGEQKPNSSSLQWTALLANYFEDFLYKSSDLKNMLAASKYNIF